MLKPTTDRLDYGELLVPPTGYDVLSAIGTSYSLDFDALVGVCIALGLSGSTDSSLFRNPVYLLETLRQTGDKVALFCEAGQIHVPSEGSALYILLEKIVYEVKVKKQNIQPIYPSFHPKFWLIKYSNKEGRLLYRVIVMSRNLTFDHSWDVAVALDGDPITHTVAQSKPLADFVNYLLSFLVDSNENTKIKRKMLQEMVREIEKVQFKTDMNEFADFDFIPVGVNRVNIGKYKMEEYPLFRHSFHEVFIMSPFLSDSVIKNFNNRNKVIENPVCTLITRRVSLDKLKQEHCSRFKIYTMKEAIVDGESNISDGTAKIYNQDIHAKLYLWRKYSDTELYLGSLNTSNSALNGNIEFMLRLKSKNRYINTDILTKSLFDGAPENLNNPFELTDLPNIIDELPPSGDVLEKKIKLFCRGINHAAVRENGKHYDIDLSFEKFDDFDGLSITPLLYDKAVPIAPIVVFEGLTLLQISEFYRITAENEEGKIQRVIKIKTDNIPQNREQAVVNEVIKDRQSFFQYISFLLGDDYLISALEMQEFQKSLFSNSHLHKQLPALYERMLSAAATKPERFAEIDYMIRMVTDDGIIPDGFTELYNTFRKAVGLNA